MPVLQAQGEDEVWYRVRGKRRRPRRVYETTGGERAVPPVESASEAAGSERTEGDPPAKGTRRRREGPGEGGLDSELPEQLEATAASS